MKELTDLEICKRIAEIEGLAAYVDGDDLIHQLIPTSACQTIYDDYNPLTDDALCFRLMVKHGITMEHFNIVNGITTQFNAYHVDAGLDSDCFDMSPNKAICLAIIETHKDK